MTMATPPMTVTVSAPITQAASRPVAAAASASLEGAARESWPDAGAVSTGKMRPMPPGVLDVNASDRWLPINESRGGLHGALHQGREHR